MNDGDGDEDIGLDPVFEDDLGPGFFEPVFQDHDNVWWQNQPDEFFDTYTTPAAGQAVLEVSDSVFKPPRKTRELSEEGKIRFAINKKMTAIKNVVLTLQQYKEPPTDRKLRDLINLRMLIITILKKLI